MGTSQLKENNFNYGNSILQNLSIISNRLYFLKNLVNFWLR